MGWTGKKVVVVASLSAAAILLGICLIGVLAAVAVPAVLKSKDNAKERKKQEKARADMHETADLVRKYAAKHGHYPNWANRETGFHLYDENEMRKFVYEDMQNHGITLQVEFFDPWGNSYQYGVNGASNEFIVICTGSDGRTTLDQVPRQHIGTHCFEDDIIWLNDGFIQEPEGRQKKCG